MYAEAGSVTTDINANTESNNAEPLLIVEVIFSPFAIWILSATLECDGLPSLCYGVT
jgi:hypothetical protein